ncbi:MAG TPA: PfkB family carbohydrate kinase [Ignavibacteriaceae bacterium]|nr:PfkB family carbohydrate kinase [Ignavibacteriaceae bacterium]
MKNITSFGEILFDVYPDYKKLGGAPFNFIYHIKKLTGYGNFISRVGNDNAGNEIVNLMINHGMPTKYLQIDNEHSTGSANANLDENKVPHWDISLNRSYDFIENIQILISLIEEETDCLYFGTLAQRGEQSRKTLNSFFGKRIKYFCDLNLRQNFYNTEIIKSSLSAANVLKLNSDELRVIRNLLFINNTDEFQSAKTLSEYFEIDLVCITQGEEGAMLYKDGIMNHYKSVVENVVDTVGAGDAYAAMLCLGYLNRWDLGKTNKLASEFAGEIIMVNGALPENDFLYDKYIQKNILS